VAPANIATTESLPEVTAVPREEAVAETLLPQPPPVHAGDLLDLSDVDRRPRPVERTLPSYSRKARRKKHTGTVDLELLVNHRGVVSEIKLVRGIDGSELNEVAMETARTWRFEPARKSDVAVDVWLPVRIEFDIKGRETRVRVVQER